MRLCFATNNFFKIQEVDSLLGKKVELLSLESIGCHEELQETQDSLEDNARQKARYVWENYRVPCFADDTGLEVEALGNAPGVISARYAGPQRNSDDNIRLLWKNLEGTVNRRAQFRTVISLQTEKGEWHFEGVVKGTILSEKKGSGGFGYDPVFLPSGSNTTLAEMSLEEKNAISHRAAAVKKLAQFLDSYTSA